jgi:predicted permease
MSSNSTAPATAPCLPLPTVRAVWWLYLTVFASIAVLAGVMRNEGVAFLVALPAANGVAIVAVVLVNCLLGRDGVRPPV